MKCPKCKRKRGKIRFHSDIWYLLGFHYQYFYSRYRCNICGWQMSTFRRVAYPEQTHTGTLRPGKSFDDDWLELCREHKLKMDNEEIAWIFEKLKRDDTPVFYLDSLGHLTNPTTAKPLTRHKLSDMIDAFKHQSSASMAVPKMLMPVRIVDETTLEITDA